MSKIALMITSCDAYKECWKPMIHSLDKYWPDCEYPRYIISNFEEEVLPNTRFVKVGKDNKSWCNLTRMGMDDIGADIIIFFQEDYWLARPVNNEAIKAHIKYFEENGLDYLKIQKEMLRDRDRIGESDYCENKPNIDYSINTAIAIWRVCTMRELMIKDWSGWEYERQIIPYIKENGITLKSQILHSSQFEEKGIQTIKDDAIVRGVWTRAAVKYLKENDMEDVIQKRKIMGPITSWLYTHNPSSQSILRYPFWGIIKLFKTLGVNW